MAENQPVFGEADYVKDAVAQGIEPNEHLGNKNEEYDGKNKQPKAP